MNEENVYKIDMEHFRWQQKHEIFISFYSLMDIKITFIAIICECVCVFVCMLFQ